MAIEHPVDRFRVSIGGAAYGEWLPVDYRRYAPPSPPSYVMNWTAPDNSDEIAEAIKRKLGEYLNSLKGSAEEARMGKFKVGDRVKASAGMAKTYPALHGWEGAIAEARDGLCWVDAAPWHPDNLDLAEEPSKPPHPSTWKPGDRVRSRHGSECTIHSRKADHENDGLPGWWVGDYKGGAGLSDEFAIEAGIVKVETGKPAGNAFKVGDRVRQANGLKPNAGLVTDTRAGTCRVLWDTYCETWYPDHALAHETQPTAKPEAGPAEEAKAEAPPSKPLNPCHHCNSETWEGLFSRTCSKGCDLTKAAAEPEPSRIEHGWLSRDRCRFESGHLSLPAPGAEACVRASGAGVSRLHPTRDGAIAAWRAAVRKT